MNNKRAYTWVIEATLFKQKEQLLIDDKYHANYYITLHGEDCDRQKHKGAHYHAVFWPNPALGTYSDSKVVRTFRALDPYKETWDYQRVKNLQSILLYVTHKEKTFHSSHITLELQDYIDKLPQVAIDRMENYVKNRDDVSKINVDSLVRLMNKHRAHNLNRLLNKLATLSQTDPNTLDLITKISGHPRIQAMERQANDIIRKQNAAVPYEKHLEQFEDTYNPKEYLSVPETKLWIRNILEHNNLDYTETCGNIAQLLMKQLHKVNCLWITGQSNAGKSVFTRSIVDAVPTHGQLLPSSDFMFQDCQDVPMIYSEETKITTDIVSDIKKVMEGTMIHANKKYKDTFELYRTTMICCSNERPEENCLSEREALHNRMIYLTFNKMDELKKLKRRLNPLFWKHHLARVEYQTV